MSSTFQIQPLPATRFIRYSFGSVMTTLRRVGYGSVRYRPIYSSLATFKNDYRDVHRSLLPCLMIGRRYCVQVRLAIGALRWICAPILHGRIFDFSLVSVRVDSERVLYTWFVLVYMTVLLAASNWCIPQNKSSTSRSNTSPITSMVASE